MMSDNAERGNERRYILVQLPEPLNEENREQRAAVELCTALDKPYTIAELTKERLRRAGKKTRDENPLFAGDLGFRVFKLDSSNLRTWDPDPDNLEQTLLGAVDALKPDREEADVLYEILLRLGKDLSTSLEVKMIEDKLVHAIAGGEIFACLEKHLARQHAEPLAAGILAWRQELGPRSESTVVFLDSAFADNTAKANLEMLLQQGGFEERLIRSL
jgi:adenine-specific DNA-methyltransferase